MITGTSNYTISDQRPEAVVMPLDLFDALLVELNELRETAHTDGSVCDD